MALLGATLLGMIAAIAVGRLIGNKVVLEAAVTLGLAAGGLAIVLLSRRDRGQLATLDTTLPRGNPEAPETAEAAETAEATTLIVERLFGRSPETVSLSSDDGSRRLQSAGATTRLNFLPPLSEIQTTVAAWAKARGPIRLIQIGVAAQALIAMLVVLRATLFIGRFSAVIAAVTGAGCLLAAGLAVMAARYLDEADVEHVPQARDLARGARVLTWVLIVSAAAIAAEWYAQLALLGVFHAAVLLVNVAICVSLVAAALEANEDRRASSVDLAPLRVLGERWNVVAGILDGAERQLGIDLRSTWALTVVRRGVEPLVIALGLVAWLSTSLTVIGVEEQGLIERLGVPVGGPPVSSGLRLHWPWPIDRVYRLPVRRIQALGVGHEGEEAGGPENVLWSVEHAANEFTLLLGNGRDLITVDAAVQFRVVDPRAWRYHNQNPMDAIRALAYRAVMRNTVNRTLSEALSENVATLTARMQAMVQEEANELGLGVEIVGFTVGGMHPPVAVAAAYEGVVSAQIAKVTAVVNAQVFRNQTLPAAEDSVLVQANAARAAGVEALARAAGDAWAFRALEAQYRASPSEYFFRRRLETLEKGLAGRSFTILDARFVRDGGEIWVTP